jgi:hypothetical protein
VMVDHYITETDDEFRHASNRTYHRIFVSLPVEVAVRYGYSAIQNEVDVERRLAAAVAAKDWQGVEQLAAQLGRTTKPSSYGDER